MFRKLISNLPFNPSLLGELSFYYHRLKKEEQIRRFGMFMVVLSLIVQTFAVISPPEPTLAASDNDVIRGGFNTKAEAVSYCRADKQGFRDVLSYHGISCDHLEQTASSRWIKSTDYNKELDSMGRESRGSEIARTGKKTDEYPVRIGGTVFYMRNLWAFDSGSYSSYKVLEVTNSHGDKIFILYSCGNIVTIGKYTPPPPPPPELTNEPEPEPEPKEPTEEPTPEPEPEPQTPVDACPDTPDFQYDLTQCDVCPNVPGVQTQSVECYPCPEAEDAKDATTACLELDKTATNLTQDIADANGTTAQPNDTIVYTLLVKNTGTDPVVDFRVEEDITDVLHYATVVDIDGGTIDDDDVIEWAEETIQPGDTLSKTITVKVKDPIPETPISTSDPTAYDLVMNNTFYGNSINIKVPQSVNKTVEIATKELPNTGPGESMLAAGAVAIVVGYFFARTYLMRKESQLVRLEYSSGGTHV